MSGRDLLRGDSDRSLAEERRSIAALLWQNESYYFTFFARTSCAARAVQVRFVFHGRVNVNDKFNVVDVHAASRNICCYEYANGTVSECRKVAVSCRLRQVAVKINRRDARVGQCPSKLFRVVLGAHEQNPASLARGQLANEFVLFGYRRHLENVVGHR
jgi:hypothetical protein